MNRIYRTSTVTPQPSVPSGHMGRDLSIGRAHGASRCLSTGSRRTPGRGWPVRDRLLQLHHVSTVAPSKYDCEYGSLLPGILKEQHCDCEFP